jgi:molybdate transport system ATP-binding protein
MMEVDLSKNIGRELLQVKHRFQEHAITQVMGISGIGKTTFLKMLAGLVKPDSGLVAVRNLEWYNSAKGVNLLPQLRRVGFVFQNYALFPNMTVQEHLLFGTNDREQVKSLLALGRMESFFSQKPAQLSGGQQQRLAILRALSTNPAVLLMDEPFSALDKTLRSEMLPELKELIEAKKITCLVVTHDRLDDFASDSFEML